jgi:hypothetical protein
MGGTLYRTALGRYFDTWRLAAEAAWNHIGRVLRTILWAIVIRRRWPTGWLSCFIMLLSCQQAVEPQVQRTVWYAVQTWSNALYCVLTMVILCSMGLVAELRGHAAPVLRTIPWAMLVYGAGCRAA